MDADLMSWPLLCRRCDRDDGSTLMTYNDRSKGDLHVIRLIDDPKTTDQVSLTMKHGSLGASVIV